MRKLVTVLKLLGDYFYRPPTKFWEGSVFVGICLPFCLHGGPHVTITHDELDLTVQGLLGPGTGPCPLDMRH